MGQEAGWSESSQAGHVRGRSPPGKDESSGCKRLMRSGQQVGLVQGPPRPGGCGWPNHPPTPGDQLTCETLCLRDLSHPHVAGEAHQGRREPDPHGQGPLAWRGPLYALLASVFAGSPSSCTAGQGPHAGGLKWMVFPRLLYHRDKGDIFKSGGATGHHVA